jgi:acetyl esterase/lipase
VRQDVTPETRALLDALDRMGLPPLHTMTPLEARAMREAAARVGRAPTPEPVASIENRSIPTPWGPLPVRLYTPADWDGTGGSVVYFHGGGWVLGNLDTHDAPCRALANSAGMLVMSVAYRLAPEFRHPAALDDAWAAAEWMAQQHVGPLFVAGDSAGGHMATCVAANARGSALRLAGQLLVYPVTDLSRFDTGSYRRYANGFWLTRASMEWFRDHYLPPEVVRTEPEVSPLLREDLTGLPPAIVVAAECDVLQDEGFAYAGRLRDAGCDVRYHRYDGVIHGFFAMPALIPEAREAINAAASFLRTLAGKEAA